MMMKSLLVLFSLAILGIVAEDICVDYGVNTCPNAAKATYCKKDAAGNTYEQPPCEATKNEENPVVAIDPKDIVMRNGYPYQPCMYGQQCWGFQQYQPQGCGCNSCPCQQYDVSYVQVQIPIPRPRPPPPPPVQPQYPMYIPSYSRQPNVRVKMNNILEVNIENNCTTGICDNFNFTTPAPPVTPPNECGCNECPCNPQPPSCGCNVCPCPQVPPPSSCGCNTCPCPQPPPSNCGCKTCPCESAYKPCGGNGARCNKGNLVKTAPIKDVPDSEE